MKKAICLITFFVLLKSASLAQTIDMSGTVSYQILNSSIVNLRVQKINNNGPLFLKSGTLQLQGWASKTPYNGGAIVGYKLAQVNLGQLMGGYFWSNISENVPYTLPPVSQKGVFHMTMILAEYTAGGFVTVDYVNMGTQVLNVLPPQINASPQFNGTKGKYFSAKVNVITDPSFPVQFSASGLPQGLSINSNDGKITGTPTVAGTFDSTISVANIAGTDKDIVRIVLDEGATTPSISNSSRYNIKNNEEFELKITASNNAYSFQALNLPQGLNLNPTDGVIRGKPNITGLKKVKLRALNNEGWGEKYIEINVTKNRPFIDSSVVASSYKDNYFEYQITGSDIPEKFNAQFLPKGLSVNMDTGLISGKPSESGIFQVTLWAQNKIGTSNKNLQLVIFNSGVSKTASIDATSSSFGMAPTKFIDNSGEEFLYYFTTYDGNKNKEPYHQWIGDGTEQNAGIYISQEARLKKGTKYTYEFDYMMLPLSLDDIYYGEIIADINDTDSNNNLIPDFLEINRNANVTTSGKLYNDYPFSIDTFNGKLRRDANNHIGEYEITTVNGKVSGNYIIFNYKGDLEYERFTDNNVLSITALAQGDDPGESAKVYANSTYEIINQDQIRLPNILFTGVVENTVIDNQGNTGNMVTSVSSGEAILNRQGSKYIGIMNLEDGSLRTSWKDYTEFVLIINDTNDADNDGIPDITDLIDNSDAGNLYFTIHPASQLLKQGKTSLVLNADVNTDLNVNLQWYKNNKALVGETSKELIINDSSANIEGSYYILASNSTKSIKSNIAYITSSGDQNNDFNIELIRANDDIVLNIKNHTNHELVLETSTDLKVWQKYMNISGETNQSIKMPSQDQKISFFRLQKPEIQLIPIVITKQPSSLTINENELASFEVKAIGPKFMRYQWFKNENEIKNANQSVYSISKAIKSDHGVYSVKIYTDNQSIISEQATLTVESVQTKPIIIEHPKDITIYRGQLATLSVKADGAGTLKYQWFKNGWLIKNATNSSFSTTESGTYKVLIINDYGTVFSDEAEVIVKR